MSKSKFNPPGDVKTDQTVGNVRTVTTVIDGNTVTFTENLVTGRIVETKGGPVEEQS